MFSLKCFGKLIGDRVRMSAYEEALRRAITSDSVVLDIGCGPGIFALLACALGARKVYGVECDDSVQLAKKIAHANGFGDRVEFIQDLSTNVTLPERADVIVSDLRDVTPLFKQHIPSIIHARENHLAPGGVLIPQRDELWVTIVESPGFYHELTDCWESQAIKMGDAVHAVTNTRYKHRVKPQQLLTARRMWGVLDYQRVVDPNLSARFTLNAERDGVGHGLLVWFDATLMPGVGFSNAPDQPKCLYAGQFLPWSQPASLRQGETIDVMIKASLVGDDYVWHWHTHVADDGDTNQARLSFKQSTFLNMPLSPRRVQRQATTVS